MTVIFQYANLESVG